MNAFLAVMGASAVLLLGLIFRSLSRAATDISLLRVDIASAQIDISAIRNHYVDPKPTVLPKR